MLALDSMNLLVAEVAARAERVEWTFSREPRLESLNELENATLLQALQGGAKGELVELPEHRVALLLRGGVRILVTAFDQPSELLVSCRKALWWAGIVRGSLPPISRADLHLFIVATSAAGHEDALLRDRSRLEADERICRKHVWLPSIDPSASDFLDSTLLAHPWKQDALTPQSLDPLQRLVETAGLPPELAKTWIEALSVLDDVRVDVLAEALSDLYEGRDDQ